MRNLLTTCSGIALVVACTSGPAELKDPPILKVTSPQRSLVQSGAGLLTVTGTVAPNADGVPVKTVEVNGVPATFGAEGGAFTASITIQPGATLITTTATDEDGGVASDTRAVQAGDLRDAGANIDNAVSAAISTEAFAKISDAASGLIKGMDLGAMIAPLQPMVHKGDENGEDCLFARVFIDDLNISDVHLSLVPQSGGIAFAAEIDGLDVPGHVRYAAACISGSNNIHITADRVFLAGTLIVSPNGTSGFKTSLAGPTVQIDNLNISASGIPGTILDLINLNSAIETVIEKGAELFMEPMMNQALGALAGPKQLDLMGKTVTVQVSPSTVAFDPTAGVVGLNMSLVISGAEGAKFIYTDNGLPTQEPGDGFAIGLADDLANEMFAEVQALNLLNLSMPSNGGTFDATQIAMSMPVMISADPTDGAMKVILGDVMLTFTSQGKPVAKAALNASIDLQVQSANNGYGVALALGTPNVHVNTLDDIPNGTHLLDADLAKVTEVCLQAQIANISKLLVNIPLPAVAGLQMRDLSVGSDDGYVMLKGKFE
jgi:glucodextranase-like protein